MQNLKRKVSTLSLRLCAVAMTASSPSESKKGVSYPSTRFLKPLAVFLSLGGDVGSQNMELYPCFSQKSRTNRSSLSACSPRRQ